MFSWQAAYFKKNSFLTKVRTTTWDNEIFGKIWYIKRSVTLTNVYSILKKKRQPLSLFSCSNQISLGCTNLKVHRCSFTTLQNDRSCFKNHLVFPICGWYSPLDKGQIISKQLLVSLDPFIKRTNKIFFFPNSTKNKFVCSIFGRIQGYQFFRNFLTLCRQKMKKATMLV